ncbi:3-isopropylmalate dehydratase small subunit [Gammaproteobacteria bacterium]|nr:3-isopropylmalate dehydratase small subunit [Gammaproteobacteria bacterium]
MRAFTDHRGVAVPLDRSNVDTDQIIPKQYLKSIKRTGFGPTLFDEWRYLDAGVPDMDHSQRPINTQFVLNQPRYAGASVLLTRDNFGCGSSREHAPWALADYGFRAIIAPSYAEIFYSNSFKSGLLPIVLPAEIVDQLIKECSSDESYDVYIDLQSQTVTTPHNEVFRFEIDESRKERLLEGLDDIGLTLQHEADILAYESKRSTRFPWLVE